MAAHVEIERSRQAIAHALQRLVFTQEAAVGEIDRLGHEDGERFKQVLDGLVKAGREQRALVFWRAFGKPSAGLLERIVIIEADGTRHDSRRQERRPARRSGASAHRP